MPEPTTYHRMALKMTTPFAKEGGAQQEWESKFALTGTVPLTQADAEATALDLWQPIQKTTSPATSLIGWTYWPAGSTVNTMSNGYSIGTHVGNNQYYLTPSTKSPNQLEVVALCRAHVGVNTKGRPIYLYKHIHDVLSDSAGHLAPPLGSFGDFLAKWNTGSGPNNLLPCAPASGGTGTFSVAAGLFTRQMRRGSKKP